MSMKSSRLGCSGVRSGWIMSALLVQAEEEENISDMREREMSVSASVNVSVFLCVVLLKGHLSSLGISICSWVPLAGLRIDTPPYKYSKCTQSIKCKV